MIGQIVGSYRIVSELGKGGMGVVYRAEHVQLGRPAALKMLLPSLSTDPAIVQRFFNEARAASAIDHPGIVEIYDYGTHTDGSAYIVMALLKGESLEQRLARGPMSLGEGANVLAQVAGALSAAHAQGIVHRDLKPDNIFLSPNELMPGGLQVQLLDFGIAKLGGERSAGIKTQTGALMGTPAYMSPEQCMGAAEIDHRTDLYSLGCILFHVLCGRPPFLSEHGTGMMIAAHIRDPPPPPRSLDPNIPEAVEAVALRLLAKDPAHRFQTAAEVRTALRGFAGATPPTYPPQGDTSIGYEPTLPPSRPPHTGTGAYAATGVPTTQSGAAAELAASTSPEPRRRSPLPWILGSLVVAGAVGAAVFLVVRSSQGGDERAEVAAHQPPADAQVTPPAASADAAPAVVATTDPAPPLPIPPAPETPPDQPPPCPEGQGRNVDTDGHCCWPEQAWSKSKDRCVGRPACPSGTRRRGEACVAVAGAPRDEPPPPRDPPPGSTPSATPKLSLRARDVAPGAKVIIGFDRPVSSQTRKRAWVTIVEASRSDSSYGVWSYVNDGATSITLEAPKRPGAYEVRLHTDYPAKRHNVVHKLAITISDVGQAPDKGPDPPPSAAGETPRAQQRFALGASSVAQGAPIEIKFAAPMRAAPGERFWVTVIEADKPDNKWGPFSYVPAGASRMTMRAPRRAGAYQVRLHANYPKKSTNLVHREPLTIE